MRRHIILYSSGVEPCSIAIDGRSHLVARRVQFDLGEAAQLEKVFGLMSSADLDADLEALTGKQAQAFERGADILFRKLLPTVSRQVASKLSSWDKINALSAWWRHSKGMMRWR